MELEPRAISALERAALFGLLAFGMLSAMYFGEYWFLDTARRHPVYFALLSFAIFWGVHRSLVNGYTYFFITLPPRNDHSRSYLVDVITTAMPGEPFWMFEETLTAIQAMGTPHETYLLDGGNDPRLRALCERLGVHHVDCTDVSGAKAGKVNHCLSHHARGDIVFIVDPDHRPRPDLLERILPYFDDEKVGFVQVVQAYYNSDESFVADAASEQTFGFYGPTMLGLNGLGLATAIGANCVFRREALDAIGGHAVHLAEDALTSMRLHAAGYRSVYVPYRGTSGLVPADLGAFFKQQLKWSSGMSELFLREYPRLFSRLSLEARLHYFFAGIFYLHAVATALTLWLPIWFLFFRVFAVEFELTEFLIHLSPYALSVVVIHLFVQRWYTHSTEKRIPWRALVLEKASWHIYLMGLLSTITARRIAYLPTPKNAVRAAVPRLVLPNLIVMALSLSAIAFAMLTYPRFDDGTLLMMFFAALNTLLLLPITLVAVLPRFNWRQPHVPA